MKRRAELHPGGLAEVLQGLLVFVSESDATLEVKPAERGRPSAGYIASIVSAGAGAHITSVGGTPELALCELSRMAMDPVHVQAVMRVATLGKVCAPREHVEDIERPGHCLWCRQPIVRVRDVAGDNVGGYTWRLGHCPVCGDERTCARCR